MQIILIDNPICYRTLVNGYFYVFFLDYTTTKDFYKQMSFHELSFNDDTTIEILKRTCGLQPRSFQSFTPEMNEEKDTSCPIVSVGCK